MSAVVLNLNERLTQSKNSPLLEKLLFEINLISKLSERFVSIEDYMCDKGFFETVFETDLEQDETIFQSREGTSFFSNRGTIVGYYGLVALELNCTGKGYVDFSCCFDNPSIERCRTHFKQEQFRMIFGKGNAGINSFERYLRSFMLAGELYPSESEDGKCAVIRSFRNVSSWPLIEGYTLRIIEPIVMHSVQDYLKQFNVDC